MVTNSIHEVNCSLPAIHVFYATMACIKYIIGKAFKMLKRVGIALVWGLAMLVSTVVSAESEWKKVHDKDGIVIKTRPFPDSAFLEFRGEMAVDYDLATVAQFLWTTEHMCSWLDDCLKVEKRAGSENDRTIYIVNAAPPPLHDRDVLIRNTLSQDPSSYVVSYTMDRLPETETLDTSYVHIPKFKGLVELIPLGPKKTVIAYQAHFEGGGIVSGWMANMLVKKNPRNTLENARETLKKNKYDQHSAIKNFPG